MKHQALFSSKIKSKKLKYRLLQFLFGTLRIKIKCLVYISCQEKIYRPFHFCPCFLFFFFFFLKIDLSFLGQFSAFPISQVPTFFTRIKRKEYLISF